MEDRIRVSILGPLLLRRGEAELSAGPPQQRALLVALVLRRGVPVSLAELIDEIWGEGAPASATAVVRQYVHGLRRVLDGGPGLTISSSQQGYVAEVGHGVLDLDVFENLVAQADHARASGDQATAADRLGEALALWRGQALAGVPGPGAGWRQPALAPRHLSALTARAELELELGRHREILPELQGMVLAHPLDEHLRHLLMTALYRCGRQADAMATYQECARLLADELGVDPGPALQALYLRLLQADPELNRTAAATAPAPKPAMLPATPTAFVGREETLRRAETIVGAHGLEPIVVVLAGMGGVGKTTTALHLAHRVAARYPDGQLHADLRGYGPAREPASVDEVLDGFLRALGVPPADIPRYPSGQTGMFRSLLAERRMLLLLDNAGSAEVVRELLPGAGRSLVLVTSRRTLPGLLVHAGVHLLKLQPPEHDEALAMFAARVGQDRVHAEPDAARDIVERSGRLPLALAVTAARAIAADHVPLATIAEELEATRGTLTGFRTDDPSADVETVLSWSYRTLKPMAAQALRHLCLHPGPHLSLTAAASMLGLQTKRAQELIMELTAAALLSERQPGQYTAHDLVRSFGRKLAQEHDDKDEQRSVIQRMLDHYLHTSWRAAHQLFEPRHQIVPGHPVGGVTTSDLEPTSWFETERPVLLAALDSAVKEGFPQHAWQLSSVVRDYLNRHGFWHDLKTTQLTGLAAATRSGQPTDEARVLWGLALAELNLRRFPAAHAHLRRSLALFTAAGDQVSSGITRRRIVYLLIEQGDLAAALEQAQFELALCSPGTDPAWLADTLNTVSWICVQLGRFDEAASHAHQAIALAPHLRPYAVADIYDTLGFAQAGQGALDDAEKSYRHAADIYHQHGASLLEAQTRRALGDAWQRAGRTTDARRAYRQALELITDSDNPRAARIKADLNRLLQPDHSPPRHLPAES
jgi:DNA-binding SARP family transcriptional activator/Flp pilus assembly protein TadD